MILIKLNKFTITMLYSLMKLSMIQNISSILMTMIIRNKLSLSMKMILLKLSMIIGCTMIVIHTTNSILHIMMPHSLIMIIFMPILALSIFLMLLEHAFINIAFIIYQLAFSFEFVIN